MEVDNVLMLTVSGILVCEIPCDNKLFICLAIDGGMHSPKNILSATPAAKDTVKRGSLPIMEIELNVAPSRTRFAIASTSRACFEAI